MLGRETLKRLVRGGVVTFTDTAWQAAKVRREIGGVFVVLRVPEEVEAVQIRMDGPPAVETPYTPLWPAVHFELRS